MTRHLLLDLQRTAGNRTTSDLVAKWKSRFGVGGTENHQPLVGVQRLGGRTQALVKQFTDGSATTNTLSPTTAPSPTKAPQAAGTFDPTNDEPHLQDVAKDHAQRVIGSVTPIEATITATLQSIADANGGKLEGLEHRLKTLESLQRKLADLARTRVKGKGETIESAVAAEAANTKDALRYTITVPPEAYAALADTKLREALADKGATRIKAANAWADPEGSYKGFNSAYEIDAPSGGRVKFEVQIHTPESWEMKSELHQQYEDARKDVRMSKAAKLWLNNYMRTRWKAVKVPKGIEAYDDKMNKR